MKYQKSDFIKFYFKFKELAILQKELNFGESPHTPSVFSENLVKLMLGYDDWIGDKDFDAKTKNNQGVEIKATTGLKGVTTIKIEQLNDSRFSHIEWIYINVNSDVLTIKKIEKTALSDFIKNNANTTEKRLTITLSNYYCCKEVSYRFTDTNIEEI